MGDLRSDKQRQTKGTQQSIRETSAAAIEQTNEYDGLGRRIVRVNVAASPDVTYDCYYNEDWQLLEERKDGDADPLNQYLWHPYYIDALAVRWYDDNTDGSGIADYYYLHDANYNVTAIANSSGAVVERGHYHPYGIFRILNGNTDPDGNPWGIDPDEVSDVGNTHWFTGRERDPETGIQFNRHRPYTSHLGRWLTRDPKEYEGSPWNLYQYVSSMPTVKQDSSGLELGISPRMRDYAKRNCKSECWGCLFTYGGGPPLGEDKLKSDLRAIETGAIEDAKKHVPRRGRRHSALRHCIASARLAAKTGNCACAECLGTQREFAQEDDGTQGPGSTARMTHANREGLKCAGCKGPTGTDPPRRRGPSFVLGEHVDMLLPPNASNAVQCCLQKLNDGTLLPTPPAPYPDREAY